MNVCWTWSLLRVAERVGGPIQRARSPGRKPRHRTLKPWTSTRALVPSHHLAPNQRTRIPNPHHLPCQAPTPKGRSHQRRRAHLTDLTASKEIDLPPTEHRDLQGAGGGGGPNFSGRRVHYIPSISLQWAGWFGYSKRRGCLWSRAIDRGGRDVRLLSPPPSIHSDAFIIFV